MQYAQRPSTRLASDDLAPATLRSYRYDLRHFVAWHHTVHDGPFVLGHLAGHELTAYRQHMVGAGLRPATVNRRLDALRRLCRWARATSARTRHGLTPQAPYQPAPQHCVQCATVQFHADGPSGPLGRTPFVCP